MVSVLKSFNFDQGLVNVISSMCCSTGARVRKKKTVTRNLATNKGITQGYPLFPHLFNIFLEGFMTDTFGDCELFVGLDRNTINNLIYADDIVILATSVENLQSLKQRFTEACERKMLTINATKIKIMKIGRKPEVVVMTIWEHG